ncbi:26S proteasome non-ATPase regulatory subunit 5 [Heterocephalus glaber]|uniref:26S proteasome non-ATPase regulatory subunit 5 n=1 Tax=Heterocephalus glaber TaxID=10181 RepID=G5C6B5_HETGA|nr:26S proteasome non-ATPase regulatory subunit 5 [Heterocephalus glaber]
MARNLRVYLRRGLTHPDDSVKLLTLSQAGRIVENSDAVTEILNNADLLKQIVYCIGGENLSVTKVAIKSLSRISLMQAGLEASFESNLLDDLKNVMKANDVARYRVYELVVEISSVSPGSLHYCTTSGLVTQLLRELTGEDMLVRATCRLITSEDDRILVFLFILGPLELFQGIRNQPFPELHCATLKVFTAIADQPWSQKLMFNSPGFVEYVMDQSVEHDKASKDAKYELVKALANSKTIAEIFGNPNYLRLRTYLSEGPYCVKPVATTAVEGAG